MKLEKRVSSGGLLCRAGTHIESQRDQIAKMRSGEKAEERIGIRFLPAGSLGETSYTYRVNTPGQVALMCSQMGLKKFSMTLSSCVSWTMKSPSMPATVMVVLPYG